MEIYVIKEGDTLYSIAKELGVSIERIIRDNGIVDADNLPTGSALVILRPEAVYPVKVGDNLLEIALKRNTSVNSIYKNNQWLNAKQEILSDGIITLACSGKKLGKISTNACAYPDIDKETLRKTLPYLTYLTVIGASVTDNGALEAQKDIEAIELSRFYGTAPILHIDLHNNRILASESIRKALISEIESYILSKRYDGVNIDLGQISPDMLSVCKGFLSEFKNICNSRGKVLFITVYCDMYEDGSLSEHTDAVTLTPITLSRSLCGSLSTNDKSVYYPIRGCGVDMTIADYSNQIILSNSASIMLAGDTDSEILYDGHNNAYFEYTDGKSKAHTVVFDDPRSIFGTLQQVCNNKNAGITVWNIDKFCPYLWSVINASVDIKIKL